MSISEEEIIKRIKQIFRKHIGTENSLSPADIFSELYRLEVEAVDIFKVMFYWNTIVLKIMRKLRRDDELFLIKRGGKWFVLQTQAEADYYKNILTQDIKNMKSSMKRADKWVKEEKWKDF